MSTQEMHDKELSFYLMTNDTGLAREAEDAGVERIGPDLEILGKESRQGHLDARISRHAIEDVGRIKAVLENSEVFVRVNPVHDKSKEEIERVVTAGAGVIMLPMFRTVEEASRFVAMVGKRAKTVLLVETPQAMVRIHEMVQIEGVDEVYFGLNDLYLGLGLHSHFEVLCSDLMDGLAAASRKHNMPYGFGAVARVDDSTLPIPSKQVLGEMTRLGASRAFISRYFFSHDQGPVDFTKEIDRIRRCAARWRDASPSELLENREALRRSLRSYRDRKPSLVGGKSQ